MEHLEFLKCMVGEFEISGVNTLPLRKNVHYCNGVVYHDILTPYYWPVNLFNCYLILIIVASIVIKV